MIHECREPRGCRCSITALEPHDDCPQHSGGPWPPRCGDCGKFLPWSVRRQAPQPELLSHELAKMGSSGYLQTLEVEPPETA